MAIRRLSPLLINQIAAGEVIERPASVVKELVENALDASATRVRVDVEQGGTALIRVADNGQGIDPDDLPLALTAHATSKLSQPEDLDAIATLGFRGEALASIASVARLTLTSRTPHADAAPTLTAEADHREPLRPAAAAPGTTVTVADLFFNTPARRKFLRTPPTEMGHITETVTRLAMVHPRVAFTLTHNQRTTLDLPALHDTPNQAEAEPIPGGAASGIEPPQPTPLHQRLAAALQLDLHDALLPFTHQAPHTPQAARGLAPTTNPNTPPHAATERSEAAGTSPPPGPPTTVQGVAGLPSLARATAKAVHLFLNGRPIRDRSLLHAIREAYRGLIPPDRHPTAAICLNLDPREVDVNVHPAKSEVRFRNPQLAHKLVLTAVRQALLAHDLTPAAHTAFPPLQLTTPTPTPTLDFIAQPTTPVPTSAFTPQAEAEQSAASGTPTTTNTADASPSTPQTSAFVDYFRRLDPHQRRTTFNQLKAALPDDPPEDPPTPSTLA
ncbi:MAG: DNA mismatch repair endonuclease MutL, partial [Planctomycetota bacterium]